MDLGLKEKRAFILAPSSGLGSAVATELVREGVLVIIASQDEKRLAAAADKIHRETGCGEDAVDYVACDLGDEDAVQVSMGTAVDRLGGLDVLVTNHGGPQTSRFPDLFVEDFDKGYRNIFRGTLVACKVALPALREGGGAITNLVAASAFEPSASGVIGNAFRLGIYGLSKMLA